MIDLTDRRVLVTGGSRGIGAATCRSFAHAGAEVAIHYHRNRSAAETLAAEIERAGDRKPLLVPGDLRDRRDIEGLSNQLEGEWDRLDTLVNNAGVWVRNPLEGLDPEKLEDTWRLNVYGPFMITNALLPLLRRSRESSIVNITSTAGQRGEAFFSPYAASKGAMISATKSWAVELAPFVRVNSVAPGWVDTDMSASALEGESRREIEATIPLGRIATAQEIAGAVLFLASDLSRDVTGEILNVNGGGVLCG